MDVYSGNKGLIDHLYIQNPTHVHTHIYNYTERHGERDSERDSVCVRGIVRERRGGGGRERCV